MIYHVLNGDGLARNFDLAGEKIVFREVLIEGDVSASSLEDFWNVRAQHIETYYGDDKYCQNVEAELERLMNPDAGDEVNFWFGDDAFCQVNMWFCMSLIKGKDVGVYRVFPDSGGWNCSFEKLDNCFSSRQALTKKDLKLGSDLWNAYSVGDHVTLKKLGEIAALGFKNLDQVCPALIAKDTKPKEILREIVNTGATGFGEIFNRFQEKASIYGYGDAQVKNLLAEIA